GPFQGDEGLPLEMARLVSGRLFNEFAELAGPFAGVAPLCLENVRAGSVGERPVGGKGSAQGRCLLLGEDRRLEGVEPPADAA
ncbi:hypothetical protein, partial [Pseudomonas aeruginosa]